MSNFLINLALRAAGVPNVASPDVSSLSWGEMPDPGLEIKELTQEETAPHPQVKASPQDMPPPDPRPMASERGDVAPQSATPASQPYANAPQPQPQVTPEQVREIQTEHHEIIREIAPAPPVEVREIIREREIVREKLVEREVRAEAPQPEERSIIVPNPIAPTPPILDLEPVSNEVIREVILQPSVQTPLPIITPSPEITTPPRRSESVAELRPEEPRREDRKTSPQPRELTVPPARPAPQPEAMMNVAPQSHTPTKEAHGLTPNESVLRPAPLDAPQIPSADEAKMSGRDKTARDKAIEVKIGSIEIRAAAPPPQTRAPEPAAPPGEAIEGFEAYRSVRRYSAWFRE